MNGGGRLSWAFHGLLSILFLASGAHADESDSHEGRPNVLILIADDQGYADLSCMGLAEDVSTPNLDRLAEEGVRFTQAYATSPICNASRLGLITGRYQQRFGTFWYGGNGLPEKGAPTLAEVLRQEGYATGYVGKFHYGRHDQHRPGRRSFPLSHGFQDFFGFSGGRKHYLNHRETLESSFASVKKKHQRRGQSLRQGPMWLQDREVDQEGFSTELIGAKAREFIQSHREDPFFLMVSFNAVHNFTHQLPQDYLDRHGLKGWRDWDPATEDYYEWYQAGRAPNNPEGRAHYLGQLWYLDREVGRVMAALNEQGIRERTIVIYLGDNGGSTPIYANNRPLRGSKYTLYEGGIRIPLILSWPNHVPSGQVLDNVVSAMDLFPTVCSWSGTPVPGELDGFDLGPLLQAREQGLDHEILFWDTNHETAVRKGRWKLKMAKSRRHADYEMVAMEVGTFLYDLEEDPGETVDLADRHPEVVAELVSDHAEWRGSLSK